jgi:hypothetical protein
MHIDTFGDIEYIRAFQHGKKDGPIEKDTVGELKFKDNMSNFYAVALFNEVFYITSSNAHSNRVISRMIDVIMVDTFVVN